MRQLGRYLQRLSSVLVVIATLTVASSSRAQQPESGDDAFSHVAGGHYERAVEHYRKGEYDAAAQLFSRAYTLTPDPMLLYNMSLAEWRGGYIRDAKITASRARQGELPDDVATKVDAQVAAYEAILTTHRLAGVEETTSPVSGRDGASDDASTEVSHPATPPATSSGGALFWSGAGLATLGAGSLIAGLVIDHAIGSEADELGQQGGRSDAEILESIESKQSIGAPLLIGGGVALLGGITMMALDFPAAEEPASDASARWQVQPTVGAGVGVSVSSVF